MFFNNKIHIIVQKTLFFLAIMLRKEGLVFKSVFIDYF